MSLKTEIKRKAEELGYLGCRIIPFSQFDEYTKYLDERVNSFPDSKELYEPLYNNAGKSDSAKSIIVCIQSYTKYKVPGSLDGMIGKMYLFDGRLSYAHENRAKQEFETYLKTLGINILQCSVPARWAAAKAGLGKFGRNNFIYSPEQGSYIIIHPWVTDVELDYDAVETDTLMAECSDACHECIKSCPTGALADSLSMDRGRCIAQLSFFANDTLDEETRTQMGSWLYGCDACQDACPVNKGKIKGQEEFPLLKDFEEYLKPENILEMDEDTYLNIVNPRFWYMGKDNLWLWKSNALRSMINSAINSGETKYHDLIKKSCNNEDERIKELAQWGCAKLGI